MTVFVAWILFPVVLGLLSLGCGLLLQTAARLHDARTGADFGIKVGKVKLNYAQAAKRKDQVVNQLRRGLSGLMKKNKIQVFRGTASFAEPKRITVAGEDETRELEASNVLIATGSAVATLPGLDLDGEKIISSDDVVTSADDPPASVIVLGSGAVGVEFASMYRDFGTEVTVVELLDRIVPAEDPEVLAGLEKAFTNRGIRVLTGAQADPASSSLVSPSKSTTSPSRLNPIGVRRATSSITPSTPTTGVGRIA